jgi:hypothetical protein
MVAYEFPVFDPDTLEPTDDRMELEFVDWYYAVAEDGPAKVPMFDLTGLDWLVRFGRDTIDNNFQCAYVATGKAGRGKSTFCQRFQRKMWKGFSKDHTHFWMDPFMRGLHDFSEADPRIGYYPGQIIDEAINGLFNQEWQSEGPYIKTFNILRKKRLTLGFAIPNLGNINPLVLPNMQFWAYMYRRGVAEIRFPFPNQFKASIYWKPICAIRFAPLNDPDWQAYNNKKDTFIQEFTSSENQSEMGGKRVKAVTEQRNSLIEWISENEWAEKQAIAERLGVSPSAISNWMSRWKPRVVA